MERKLVIVLFIVQVIVLKDTREKKKTLQSMVMIYTRVTWKCRKTLCFIVRCRFMEYGTDLSPAQSEKM